MDVKMDDLQDYPIWPLNPDDNFGTNFVVAIVIVCCCGVPDFVCSVGTDWSQHTARLNSRNKTDAS